MGVVQRAVSLPNQKKSFKVILGLLRPCFSGDYKGKFQGKIQNKSVTFLHSKGQTGVVTTFLNYLLHFLKSGWGGCLRQM